MGKDKSPGDFFTERQKYLKNLEDFFGPNDSGVVVDLIHSEDPLNFPGKLTSHIELGESFDSQNPSAIFCKMSKNEPCESVSYYSHDCWCEPELLYMDSKDNQVWMHKRIQ